MITIFLTQPTFNKLLNILGNGWGMGMGTVLMHHFMLPMPHENRPHTSASLWLTNSQKLDKIQIIS